MLQDRHWDHNTVGKILERQEYVGNTVNFKTTSKDYRTKKRVMNDEEKRKIITLEDLIENGEKQAKDLKHLLANVRKYTDPEELTPEMLNDLVDKILVHAPDKSSGHRTQRIEIYYNAVDIIDLPTNTGSGQATSASKLAV